MKFFGFLIVIGIALVVLFYPPVNKERLCYEKTQDRLDTINSNVLTRNLLKSDECSQRSEALYSLETCIQEATKSSTAARFANDTVQRLVAVIRPYTHTLWTMKEDHNLDCTDYSWNQLP